jgi:hypothetical protein
MLWCSTRASARWPASASSYPGSHPVKVPILRSPVSCCLSAVGIRFLGHPAPAEALYLPHGRPTGVRAGPQRGCRVAHDQDATGQGTSFTPRTVVRSRPATILRPAPAALRGQSLPSRWNIPSAEVTFTRRHQRFTRVCPSPKTAGCPPGPGSTTASRRSSPRLPPSDGTRAASASTSGFAPRGYPQRTPRSDTGRCPARRERTWVR